MICWMSLSMSCSLVLASPVPLSCTPPAAPPGIASSTGSADCPDTTASATASAWRSPGITGFADAPVELKALLLLHVVGGLMGDRVQIGALPEHDVRAGRVAASGQIARGAVRSGAGVGLGAGQIVLPKRRLQRREVRQSTAGAARPLCRGLGDNASSTSIALQGICELGAIEHIWRAEALGAMGFGLGGRRFGLGGRHGRPVLQGEYSTTPRA
jgi:hypothetical protein